MLSIFYIPIAHLYVFFGKMFIQVLYLFFNRVNFFYCVCIYAVAELSEFLRRSCVIVQHLKAPGVNRWALR